MSFIKLEGVGRLCELPLVKDISDTVTMSCSVPDTIVNI